MKTPIPWRVMQGQYIDSGLTINTANKKCEYIASISKRDCQEDNAAFIVEACNNYEALKKREAALTNLCKDALLCLQDNGDLREKTITIIINLRHAIS